MSDYGEGRYEYREWLMIIVIGAGPAGLAAAEAASRNGSEVALIDSASRLGGQYWRHRSQVSGYRSNRADLLFAKVRGAASITYISEATVWSIEREGELIRVNYLQGGSESSLTAEKLILATGAYDRSLPFPGWDQPGSMTPGAAQALLKGHGVLAGQSVVVAGTGPFLLPVATGLAEAGANVIGLYEAHSPMRWLLSPQALLLNVSKFAELIYYAGLIRKHRITPRFGRVVSRFDKGQVTISGVNSEFSLKKPSRTIEVDVVAVGWGFSPDLTLGGIAGCKERVDIDGTTVFAVDAQQLSSQKNIWIAGEATGIGGADLSLLEGEIAGLAASGQGISSQLRMARYRKQVFADALKRSYPVKDGWRSWAEKSTVVCRCEEVSLGEIEESVVELGAEDSRTAKLFTRAGMGLCQGRVCSRNVSEIVAGLTKCAVTDEERIASSNRPIAAPIALGLLGDGKM
jgi:NADPH-dependent 2,4-dienoyl-CoA reductase/sulfur reductase-like enzyme